MAILEIPIRNDVPAFREQVDLEGRSYFLEFTYSSRAARWHMTIEDENQDKIIAGVPVLVKQDLFGRYKDSRLPPGIFMAVNQSAENTQPSRENFSTDVLLLYEEAS